jgi:hypothetical protein
VLYAAALVPVGLLAENAPKSHVLMPNCIFVRLQRQDKADEDMDALFGESSGDEDYDPNAPDPLAAGGDAAGSPAGEEEAEYVSDGDAEREALAEVHAPH